MILTTNMVLKMVDLVSTKQARVYGYALLINELEPALRSFIANDILLIKYGQEWVAGIPPDLPEAVKKRTNKDNFLDPAAFLENTDFSQLKEICIYKNNFNLAKNFYGDINQEEYCSIMDLLYDLRIKVAHAKRTFSIFDFQNLIESVLRITKGESAAAIREYIEHQKYKEFKEIPLQGLVPEENKCIFNLPPEDYDFEGGFVGRLKDLRRLKSLLYSDQDRVITVIGGGGVGKTAFALKTAYSILDDKKNPFNYIIWFSAKTNRLSYEGIVDIEPQIKSLDQLTTKVLEIMVDNSVEIIKLLDSSEKMQDYLFSILKKNKTLLIIDNLETIINDQKLSRFIQEIPRQAKVLITSRRGLGEIERRFTLSELENPEAIELFRLICKDKNLNNLLRLEDYNITPLLKRVQNYPLVIKWTLGQISLGKTVEGAFNQSLQAKSDIAKFCFEDVFQMLGANERKCLYGIVFFEEPPSQQILRHVTNLNEDLFEEAIKKLILASFIFPIHEEDNNQIKTRYSVLSLTRDFVLNKLEDDKIMKNDIENRYAKLKIQPEYIEKSYAEYTQMPSSLGTKSLEDNIALIDIKNANFAAKNNKTEEAERLYKEALNLAPTLTYAYTTYARFEFERGNYGLADKLMERASLINPNDFNVWHNWGIMKRRHRDITSAEKYFLKAQQLEPDNPSLLNDLGRIYTFEGQYQEADQCFKKSSKPKKYINYRHQLITFEYIADNFRRWAQQFIRLRDYDSTIQKLKEAQYFVSEARKLDPNDLKLLWLEKKVILARGICLSYQDKFEDARKDFLDCIAPVKLSNMKVLINSDLRARSYYYLARFGSKRNDYTDEEIEILINKGLAVAPEGNPFKTKLETMLKNFGQYKTQKIPTSREYLRGIIVYYNIERKYGFIHSGEERFFFNIRNFGIYINKSIELLYKEVIFMPQKNEEAVNRLATQIMLL
jgi:tetratricopeptide (TPR) repeat protein